jgi:excinuclease UvrABC nuclease subunit
MASLSDDPKEWGVETVFLMTGELLAKRKIPAKAGIYFITMGLEILYIGSSVNLRARLAQHRTSRKWGEVVEVRLLLFHERLACEMREMEHELIYCLRPKANVVMNPDSNMPQSCTRNPMSVWARDLIRRMA